MEKWLSLLKVYFSVHKFSNREKVIIAHLQWLPNKMEPPTTSNHVGSGNPFKVPVNFDIPWFEGQIDVNILEKWLSLLEGCFSIHKFSNREKVSFALLKVVPHVKDWWEIYYEQHFIEESRIFGVESTWEYFVDALKEKYSIGNYDDQYMRWTTLCQESDQMMSKYTNILHTLWKKMGTRYSMQHLVLKYHSGLHRYTQKDMDLSEISSLGVSYWYVIKVEKKK